MPPTVTRRLLIDPVTPDPRVLAEAAAILRAGGLVAFPTETVYGLGADALSPTAVRRVFEAKGRPPTNPLIVHVSDEAMLRSVTANWPSTADVLAARFWPGPLTLVLPKGPDVPDVVTGGGPTVAIRMPAHAVAIGLIRAAGVPLAAPSANRSSELSPTRAEHVLAGLNGRIDLILDGGPTTRGIESTVLDVTADPPVVLRPGPITAAAIEAVIGVIGHRPAGPASGPQPSPGLLPRHYAPRTPVELHSTRAELESRARDLRAHGKLVAAIVIGGKSDGDIVSMPADAAGYAARLYDVLHSLDADGFSLILVELPPDLVEWAAVRDRLRRAATR